MNNLTTEHEKLMPKNTFLPFNQDQFDNGSSMQFLQQSAQYLGVELTQEALVERYSFN